jgi:hypothetical protein
MLHVQANMVKRVFSMIVSVPRRLGLVCHPTATLSSAMARKSYVDYGVTGCRHSTVLIHVHANAVELCRIGAAINPPSSFLVKFNDLEG